MIEMACASCQKTLSIKDELRGKHIKCPLCGQVMAVCELVKNPASSAEIPLEQTLDLPVPPAGEKTDAGQGTRDETNQSTMAENTASPLGPRSGDEEEAETRNFAQPRGASSATMNGPNIPGFEMLGELGRGGMGVVFKARQIQLKRLVALKMIRAGSQAGDVEIARFRIEAEAVARLQHANIVQIHEIGENQPARFARPTGGTVEFLGRDLFCCPLPWERE